jgi:hypothetical protein
VNCQRPRLNVALACAVAGLMFSVTAPVCAKPRQWQTGTLVDIDSRRRIVDFGPGSSPFSGQPGPGMRAMADVRVYVIESGDLRLEAEDTVAIGRRTIDAMVGEKVSFAVDKKSVWVLDSAGVEHRLRLTRKGSLIPLSGQTHGP